MFKLVLLSCVILTCVYLYGKSHSFPQLELSGDEDYASYANLYPEIAKKIGEEPIEIIDVVKAVLVYDSDRDSLMVAKSNSIPMEDSNGEQPTTESS